MKDKVCLALVSSPEDVRFVTKFEPSLATLGISLRLVSVTTFASIYMFFKGKIPYHVRSKSFVVNYKFDAFEASDSFNFKAKLLPDVKAVNKNAFSFYQGFSDIFMKMDVRLSLIPSGRMISHQMLDKVSKENNVSTLYIGYGNFPNRTFFDPVGTDRASKYYQSFNSLGDARLTETFIKWKDDYIKTKESTNKIPQRKSLHTKWLKRFGRSLLSKIDKLLGIAVDIDYSVREALLSPIHTNRYEISNPQGHYGFHALQLSEDAQIIMNTSKDQLKLIEEFAKRCEVKKLTPFIKIHPAESSVEFVNNVIKTCAKYNVGITNGNTFKLLKNSSYNLVVNSTVGLEAKLLGVNIEFEEECLFSKMTVADIEKYVFSDLYAVNYFNQDPISQEIFQKLIDSSIIKC